MTDEDIPIDWLKVTKKGGEDDPMFELDRNKLKIICNQNNKHFVKLAQFLEKMTGTEFPLRYMMLSLSFVYLIMKAGEINESTKKSIVQRDLRLLKAEIKTLGKIIPDAKVRGKITAKNRRKKFGDDQSTMARHQRATPPMHFECWCCEGPSKLTGFTRMKYEKREQWWRNLSTWIRKSEHEGTNELRDYLTSPKEQGGCGLEIQDFNVDALWQEFKKSEFNKKKKKPRKYPRKDEKLKSVTAENIKTDLENKGIPVADIPTDDSVLKDQAEDVLLYIRTFRTRRPDFEHDPKDLEQSEEDTWKEVARMNDTTEWEKIRELVYKYCDDNDMDIEATLGTKEYRVSNASDEHEHHDKTSNHAPI